MLLLYRSCHLNSFQWLKISRVHDGIYSYLLMTRKLRLAALTYAQFQNKILLCVKWKSWILSSLRIQAPAKVTLWIIQVSPNPQNHQCTYSLHPFLPQLGGYSSQIQALRDHSIYLNNRIRFFSILLLESLTSSILSLRFSIFQELATLLSIFFQPFQGPLIASFLAFLSFTLSLKIMSQVLWSQLIDFIPLFISKLNSLFYRMLISQCCNSLMEFMLSFLPFSFLLLLLCQVVKE